MTQTATSVPRKNRNLKIFFEEKYIFNLNFTNVYIRDGEPAASMRIKSCQNGYC